MIYDIVFNLENFPRIFNKGSLTIEWTINGVKVIGHDITIKETNNKKETFEIKDGDVVAWEKLSCESEFEFIPEPGCGIVTFKVQKKNAEKWLKKENLITTPDIMKQTALALEEVYGGATTVEELKKCLAKVEAVLPVDVDDNLRQSVMERWQRKLRETAAATFANGNSTEQELNKAYEVFIQPH